MADYALGVTNQREHFVREDGSTYTRNDIFVKLSVTFRDRMLRKLKGAKLSVLLCISLHCGEDMQAFPSLATIADETDYTEQSVRTAIKELEEAGLIEVVPRFQKNHGQTSNLYKVHGFITMGDDRDDPDTGGTKNNTRSGYENSTPPPVLKVLDEEEPIEEEPIKKDDGANAPSAQDAPPHHPEHSGSNKGGRNGKTPASGDGDVLGKPGTAAAKEFWRQFRRKRWSSYRQREKWLETEQVVGTDIMMRAVKWAAESGANNPVSVCTTALNMAKDGPVRGSPPPQKRVIAFTDPDTGQRVQKEIVA